MSYVRSLAMAVLMASLGACSVNVRSLRKQVTLNDQGNHLFVQGRWAVRTTPERSSLPSANTVQVECSKRAGTCRETLALLYQATDRSIPSDSGNHLALLVQDYDVVEWSITVIRAQAKPRAADLEIKVSLSDKSADRTARETGARGASMAQGANVEAWVLE